MGCLGRACRSGCMDGHAKKPYQVGGTGLAAPGRMLLLHPEGAVTSGLLRGWSFPPTVVAGLGLGAWLNRRGLNARFWWAGLAVIAVALLSPLDALSDDLFAAHMVQHLLLIMIAAPLLVLGEPTLALLWALPLRGRRAVGAWWRTASGAQSAWHLLSAPLAAFTVHVVAVWAWHLPRLYALAVRSPVMHAFEHVVFLVTAMLFWRVVLDRRARNRLGAGPSVIYLFGAALQSTVLGAAISLAPHPWYTAHLGTTRMYGLSPLEDQQLAGLIMWVPAGVVYIVAMILVVLPVLRERVPSVDGRGKPVLRFPQRTL